MRTTRHEVPFVLVLANLEPKRATADIVLFQPYAPTDINTLGSFWVCDMNDDIMLPHHPHSVSVRKVEVARHTVVPRPRLTACRQPPTFSSALSSELYHTRLSGRWRALVRSRRRCVRGSRHSSQELGRLSERLSVPFCHGSTRARCGRGRVAPGR